MIDDVISFILGLVPAIITSLAVFYLQRRQKKSDAEREKREHKQQQAALLQMELEMATAKLSFATAMAVKRGKANGEIEDGIDAYEKAKKSYYAFLNAAAIEHLKEKE